MSQHETATPPRSAGRASSPGAAMLALCGLIGLVLDLLVGLRDMPQLWRGELVNPDSSMRLVRLYDMLAAGHPLDVIARDASGDGMVLHWSHLIDSLLCLLATPLTLFLPMTPDGPLTGTPTDAIYWAGVAFGPLCMAALGAALAWAAAPLADRRFLWLAPVLSSLSPALSAYGVAGVIHHHIPLVVAVTMLAGHVLRAARGETAPGTGFAVGAWSVVGIWLTPEAMPFVLLAFAGLWLAWLAAPAPAVLRRMIGETAVAFLLLVTAVFLVDPPLAETWRPAMDRMSTMQVTLAACTALAAALCAPIDRLGGRPTRRRSLGLLAGVACIGVWFALFPDILRGPEEVMSAADAHAYFDRNLELQPVDSVSQTFLYLLPGALAAVLLVGIARRQKRLMPAYAAACGILLVGLGVEHLRFSSYPEAMAAVLLPVAAMLVTRWLQPRGERAMATGRVALIFGVLLLPLGPLLIDSVDTKATAQVASGNGLGRCRGAAAARMLAPYPGAVVLANINESPELLLHTRVRVVASLYQRNIPAFHRLIAALASPPTDTLPPAVAAARVDLVLFCPQARQVPEAADRPAASLYGALEAGRVPPWLVEVGRDAATGQVLYRVRR
jgi:hypothetical protein